MAGQIERAGWKQSDAARVTGDTFWDPSSSQTLSHDTSSAINDGHKTRITNIDGILWKYVESFRFFGRDRRGTIFSELETSRRPPATRETDMRPICG